MFISLILPVALSAAAADKPISINGDWRTPAMGGATIRFGSCGKSVCGKIVAINGDSPKKPMLDENNPDPSKRNQRLVGKSFITGMKGGPTIWKDGKIYHPPTGRTVSGNMRLIDSRTIELEACLMLMCKKSKLTRISK